MVKTKLDALQAPKNGRVKGAMHAAGVAAARIKATLALSKKKRDLLVLCLMKMGEEGEEVDDESEAENSFSSTSSQHVAKRESLDKMNEKSNLLEKGRETEKLLQ